MAGKGEGERGDFPYDLGPDDFVEYVQRVEWGKGRTVPRIISVPSDVEEFVDRVVERKGPTPTIVVPPTYPYTPPPEHEGLPGPPISGLSGVAGSMAAANMGATLLARGGCLACPVGQFNIVMPWVYPPAYLNILARLNAPHGCAPFIIARVDPIIGVAMILKVWYCIPIPIAWVLGVGGAIASAVSEAVQAIYVGFIPSLCREFADRALRRAVGPCLGLVYADLFLASITIRACFRKCIDQLKKGLDLAKELDKRLRVLYEEGGALPWWIL